MSDWFVVFRTWRDIYVKIKSFLKEIQKEYDLENWELKVAVETVLSIEFCEDDRK